MLVAEDPLDEDHPPTASDRVHRAAQYPQAHGAMGPFVQVDQVR